MLSLSLPLVLSCVLCPLWGKACISLYKSHPEPLQVNSGTSELRASNLTFWAAATAHALGSTSMTTGSSRTTFGRASLGTCIPRNPNCDGTGLTRIRGQSVFSMSNESSSIFACKNQREAVNKV
ncbi:hypothetical protein AMTR_s00198p00042030 [Amborella trichopoda]|uniref:Secreted protein n=1 Tax=Amborella trichopoda TaxID=13333 RepID=U5DC48_AMBTC|nr:hypothetical protein AMTR_s00198p00042030 [Amborella trichopoda]